MTSSEGEAVNCPVCQKHGRVACLEAQGLVITAAEALANGDKASVVAAYEASQPYDFHIAVTMLVQTIDVLAEYTGTDPYAALSDLRRQVNEAIAEAGTRDPGSSDPS